MKKLSATIAICMTVSCFAFSKPSYLRGDIGFSNQIKSAEDDRAPWIEGSKFENMAPMLGLGVGYQVSDKTRFEINIQHRRPSYDDVEALIRTKFHNKNYTAFANGYYDFINFKGNLETIPYITGGVGFSRNVTSTSTDDDIIDNYYPGNSKNSVAFNVGFGSRMKVDSNLDFDIGYRFLYLGKIKFKDQPDGSNVAGKTMHWRAHEISLGLIYNF